MKIKFKKEMTLDELIKWAWENPELVRGEKFYAQGKSNETYVYFHLYDGRKCILREYISADDTFEVEYEEEITEETVIPKLVKMYKDGKMSVYNDYSIKRSLLYSPKAYYILNDDLTMTLIWKDGELVGRMMQTYKVSLCIKFLASKCNYKLKKHYFVQSTNEEEATNTVLKLTRKKLPFQTASIEVEKVEVVV